MLNSSLDYQNNNQRDLSSSMHLLTPAKYNRPELQSDSGSEHHSSDSDQIMRRRDTFNKSSKTKSLSLNGEVQSLVRTERKNRRMSSRNDSARKILLDHKFASTSERHSRGHTRNNSSGFIMDNQPPTSDEKMISLISNLNRIADQMPPNNEFSGLLAQLNDQAQTTLGPKNRNAQILQEETNAMHYKQQLQEATNALSKYESTIVQYRK